MRDDHFFALKFLLHSLEDFCLYGFGVFCAYPFSEERRLGARVLSVLYAVADYFDARNRTAAKIA